MILVVRTGHSDLVMLVQTEIEGCHISNRRVLRGAEVICHVATKGMSLQCPLLTRPFCSDVKGELKRFSNSFNGRTTHGVWKGYFWRDAILGVVARRRVALSGAFLVALSFGVPRDFVPINRKLFPRQHTSLQFAFCFPFALYLPYPGSEL